MADTAPYRYARKAKKAPRPVKRLTLPEVFADLAEAGEQALAKRQKFREASKGKPPTRLWKYAGEVTLANTRSEARGIFKKLFRHKLGKTSTPVEVTSNKQKDAP